MTQPELVFIKMAETTPGGYDAVTDVSDSMIRGQIYRITKATAEEMQAAGQCFIVEPGPGEEYYRLICSGGNYGWQKIMI